MVIICHFYAVKCPLLHRLLVFVLLLMHVFVYAQQEELLSKAEKLLFSEPEEALKIGGHVLQTSDDIATKSVAAMLMGRAHMVQGNYNAAVESIFTIDTYSEALPLEILVSVAIQKANICRALYLDKQYNSYMAQAQRLSENLSGTAKTTAELQILMESIYMQLERTHYDEALSLLATVENNYETYMHTYPKYLFYYKLLKAKQLASCGDSKETLTYLLQILNKLKDTSRGNVYVSAVMLNELGKWYNDHQQYKLAEHTFLEALTFAKKLQNVALQERIVQQLSVSYLAQDNQDAYKQYGAEFLVLNTTVEQLEQEAVNTLFGLLTTAEEKAVADAQSKNANKVLFLLLIAGVIVLVAVLILLRSHSKNKRLQEIINYIVVSRKNFLKPTLKKTPEKKSLNIPEATEKAILEKLKRFEKTTKFTSSDMSLSVLAGQFETNTKYLSEIINKHYNDNFNTFINKLRISYIIEKLRTDPEYVNYKISFLASESGFSSHSNFATVFKSIVGMTPATFINLLKEEKEHEKLPGTHI